MILLRSLCRRHLWRHEKRGYAKVTERDIVIFKEIVGKDHVITDSAELASYNVDWMKHYRGKSRVALRPRTTSEVSDILRHCNASLLPVVPQGGNTGLVGGSVPVDGEVILSLSRMSTIEHFDPLTGALICGAGCVLEVLDNWLAERGFCMPLDLGAKGTAQIGGNVSTCAGGIRFIKYGSLRGNVLGLEVVLANGKVLDLLTTCAKDNAGIDLKQMFIGSEGILGVVTKVAISAKRRPASVNVALLACENFEAVLQLVKAARSSLADIISALELMDNEAVENAFRHFPALRRPFRSGVHPFYVLVETSGTNAEHDVAKVESFLENAFAEGLVLDGVLSQDASQSTSLWAIRDAIPMSSAAMPAQFKYDLSVPSLEKFYDLVGIVRQRLKDQHLDSIASAYGYGHLGDGNLHLNVVSTGERSDEILNCLEPFVMQWIASNKGSISAEHGIGQHKRKYLELQRGPHAIEVMRNLKTTMDPNCILNPFKLLP